MVVGEFGKWFSTNIVVENRGTADCYGEAANHPPHLAVLWHPILQASGRLKTTFQGIVSDLSDAIYFNCPPQKIIKL